MVADEQGNLLRNTVGELVMKALFVSKDPCKKCEDPTAATRM